MHTCSQFCRYDCGGFDGIAGFKSDSLGFHRNAYAFTYWNTDFHEHADLDFYHQPHRNAYAFKELDTNADQYPQQHH